MTEALPSPISEVIAGDDRLAGFFAGETERSCRTCGNSFLATGIQGICDTCANAPARPKPVAIRSLGESWPARHQQKLSAMAGPSLEKASALLPKILEGANLVLAGDRGRGKTQIATWIAWQLGLQGKDPGLYAKTFGLFTEIKASWSKKADSTEADVMAAYKAAPFLALDECHERGETEWENRTLRNVFDCRYDECLPTIIIGNWTTTEEIAASLGASVVDRITETGGVVWCKWESYRVNPS